MLMRRRSVLGLPLEGGGKGHQRPERGSGERGRVNEKESALNACAWTALFLLNSTVRAGVFDDNPCSPNTAPLAAVFVLAVNAVAGEHEQDEVGRRWRSCNERTTTDRVSLFFVPIFVPDFRLNSATSSSPCRRR